MAAKYAPILSQCFHQFLVTFSIRSREIHFVKLYVGNIELLEHQYQTHSLVVVPRCIDYLGSLIMHNETSCIAKIQSVATTVHRQVHWQKSLS